MELVKRLGADVAMTTARKIEHVATDCDVVLDSAGGDTLRSFECVKPGGVVVSIGGTPSAAFAPLGLNPLLVFALAVMSGSSRPRRGDAVPATSTCSCAPTATNCEITRLVEARAIAPVIDRTFPLAQVREALAYSEAGRATGKVITMS